MTESNLEDAARHGSTTSRSAGFLPVEIVLTGWFWQTLPGHEVHHGGFAPRQSQCWQCHIPVKKSPLVYQPQDLGFGHLQGEHNDGGEGGGGGGYSPPHPPTQRASCQRQTVRYHQRSHWDWTNTPSSSRLPESIVNLSRNGINHKQTNHLRNLADLLCPKEHFWSPEPASL